MIVGQVNQESSKIVDYFNNSQDIYSQLEFNKIMELI